MKGLAWAGESNIRQVEVSGDGGRNWSLAQLVGPAIRYSWRMFEHEWKVPEAAGQYKLLARATDELGRAQPLERSRGNPTYPISHVLPLTVDVH